MEVKLLSYNPDALELLIYTKNTRLRSGLTLASIKAWPEEKKAEHLDYMLDTIQSSWEFSDYTFEISGVTRAFTHQLVRTRTGSYAQEAQRVVDLSEAEWMMPLAFEGHTELAEKFAEGMEHAFLAYAQLRDMGAAAQDARGLVPTNVCTSVVAKFNLRTLHDMAEKRLCFKTQGEFQAVFKAMKALVVEVHPWAERFMNVYCINHGTCAFPRFHECPIQHLTIDAATLLAHKIALARAWSKTEFEANPQITQEGMTT